MGETLGDRPLIWVAAVLVNAVAAVAMRSRGLGPALLGYLPVHHGRVLIRRGLTSLQRLLAVVVASLIAGVAVRAVLAVAEQLGRPPAEPEP